MSFDSVMGMPVSRFILAVDMRMIVDMGVFMGMYQITVGMLMGVVMTMFVGMLQRNGVLYHQRRCHDHNSKSYVKSDARPFPKKQHTEQNPQKGCNRIISTGFRRA